MIGIAPEQFYQATSYRSLIEAWIESLRRSSPSPAAQSFRALAKRFGFASPNFLQLLISGKRNLGFEGFTKISKAMKLSALEREFFWNLVQFNQAETPDEKQKFYEATLQLKKRAELKQNLRLPIQDYEYLSNWLNVALRELLIIRPQVRSVEEIQKELEFPAAIKDIQKALDFLKSKGLIEENDGQYLVHDPSLASSDETSSLAIRNFHRQLLHLGIHTLESIALKDREFGAITLALSPEQFRELKLMMKEFRKAIHEKFARAGRKADVYQVQLISFPLTTDEAHDPRRDS